MSQDCNSKIDFDYFYSIRPCLGERLSGDTAIVEQKDNLLAIAIIDALGHGNNAHEVANAARSHLQNWHSNVCQTMIRLHQHLKGSLGAAVGLGILDLETNQLSYTGVGNTVIRVLRQQNKADIPRLYSTEGIVGGHISQHTEQKIQLYRSDLVLFYTDGVKEHFDVRQYRDIFTDDVMTVAKNIVRLFGKNYDDATCIALKIGTNFND